MSEYQFCAYALLGKLSCEKVFQGARWDEWMEKYTLPYSSDIKGEGNRMRLSAFDELSTVLDSMEC